MNDEQLNNITMIKADLMGKIRWRCKQLEKVRASRWRRNYTESAEWYYFWEIECRGFGTNYIPLEEDRHFYIQDMFKLIEVPELVYTSPCIFEPTGWKPK